MYFLKYLWRETIDHICYQVAHNITRLYKQEEERETYNASHITNLKKKT